MTLGGKGFSCPGAEGTGSAMAEEERGRRSPIGMRSGLPKGCKVTRIQVGQQHHIRYKNLYGAPSHQGFCAASIAYIHRMLFPASQPQAAKAGVD